MDETIIDATRIAREAISRGDWDAALTALEGDGGAPPTDADGLQALADAAYGAGDLERAVDAFEQLHQHHLRQGDPVAAAGAATQVAMYLMMDTGLMAPVRGWALRAERLLAGRDETPVHAWLAMVRTYERFMCGDVAGAEVHARRAIDVGTRQREPAPTTIARIATARLRILAGEVEDGLALLDEAASSVMSGELDPLPTGMAYCELICAMQGLAQYDRAEEWTLAMERWRHGTAFGGINGRCRVHRAEILRLRGSCEEAEAEALHACEELRPWMRREFGWPLTELGTNRLRRGDLDGARAAFLAAHEHGWDPNPGLALLLLAQGDVEGATHAIRDALDHPRDVPSKERPPHSSLQRAPLLEARAVIEAAAGDVARARAAAAELTEVADRFHSRALQAGAAAARGHVALTAGDAVTAIAEFEVALAGWTTVGAPFEAAAVRLSLADALDAEGHPARAARERSAGRAAAERIGAGLLLADAAPPPTPPRSRPTGTVPTGVFARDGDTWAVGLDGHVVRLRDLKGLRYVARLLAEPGREFHALDLVAVERGSVPDVGGTAAAPDGGLGPLLDDRARRAYRRRLADIDEDIEEARRMCDPERAALAERDRDFIVRELARAVGLGGRPRPTGSSAERARTSVTRSIRYALARIAEHHPPVAAHLEHAVRTGTYCAYQPDPAAPVAWTTT